MKLKLDSLELAVSALRRSVETSRRYMDDADADLAETVRAGVIQHFEVAFELCWKFIQRWLKENRPDSEIDLPRTRRDLFRDAARAGLVADPAPWFSFADSRNLTSHTYDVSRAEQGYETAVTFLPHAEALLSSLRSHND